MKRDYPTNEEESLIKAWHQEGWMPCSHWIDTKIQRFKILRMLKTAFDVHFTMLGVLGVFATPPHEIDCYFYIFKRAKPHKYQHLEWKNRLRMLNFLLNKIWSA